MSKAATLGQMANLMSAQLAYRNRIINGGMDIDQRLAGGAVTPTTTGYIIDRWKLSATQSSKLTLQQNAGSVTPPAGFQNYLGVTVAATYTPASTDSFLLQQIIEGFNCGDLSWGTSNAQPVSLQFYVYASVTGTYTGALVNAASNRSYVITFSITSANTWTLIKIPNIPGDTSGTWTFNSNGVGIVLEFSLGAGSSALGVANAWQSANAFTATGAVNLLATSGAVFYVTGVQLEKGPICTSFERMKYNEIMASCQRYYEKSFADGVAPANYIGSTNQVGVSVTGQNNIYPNRTLFQVRKRANPTISFYAPPVGSTSGDWCYYTSAWGNAGSTSAGSITLYGFDVTLGASGTSGYQAYLIAGNWVADADL